MKRIYYIANSYDGAYFVLTDNIEEYFQRVAAYVLNLEQSAKLNNYSFGSVEMSEKEYEDYKAKASNLEKAHVAKPAENQENVEQELQNNIEEKEEKTLEEELEEFTSPRKPLRSERPHLRLV
jgi:hypothetical protein